MIQGIRDYAYENVLSFAMPVGERFGLTALCFQTDRVSGMNKHTMWERYALGGGVKVSDESWPVDFYLGGSVAFDHIREGGLRYDGTTKIMDRFNEIEFDTSFLFTKSNVFFKEDTLRFGALIQSCSDIRPEISYTLKDKSGKTTLAVTEYPLYGDNYFRAGVEREFNTQVGKISLRAGYDGALGIDFGYGVKESPLTVGIGYDSGKFGIDISNTSGKLTLVGAKFKF